MTKTPTAFVEEKILNDRANFVRLLLIKVCPICGKKHQHGGGRPDEMPILGIRVAHCTKNPMGLRYELVMSGNPTIIQPKVLPGVTGG